MRATRSLGALAAAVGLALGSGVAMQVVGVSAAGASTHISGSVTCDNGWTVEGIWIAAQKGGSGWAAWTSYGPSASFSFSLPYGGAWTVHVGCGGRPSTWRSKPDGISSTTSTYMDWQCDNPYRYYGACYEA